MSSDTDDTPDRRRLFGLGGLAGLLAIPFLVIWWPGCRQYPPVTSGEGLVLIKLAYAACNGKDEKRLTEVERRAAKLEAEGKLSPKEKAAFAGIVAKGRAGDWKAAEDAAFRFAEDQVR